MQQAKLDKTWFSHIRVIRQIIKFKYGNHILINYDFRFIDIKLDMLNYYLLEKITHVYIILGLLVSLIT